MSIFRTILCAATLITIIVGCATVRQPDLDAWVGVPAEALDSHPLFLTIPMYRTLTDGGVEIRNYVNSKEVQRCFTTIDAHHGDRHYLSHTAFLTCSDDRLVCNNLFYLQGGKVLRYAPTGDCFTDDRVRPQSGTMALRSPAR